MRLISRRGWLTMVSLLIMLVASFSFLDRINAAAGNITWTPHPASDANNWIGVTWSPELGLFAAVSNIGTLNRVMTSPDGNTWTPRSALAANDHWRSITWSSARNLFVAVGS